MLRVAKYIVKTIVVAHYHSYCSKYNAIERRLFCNIEKALDGTLLIYYQKVKMLLKRTKGKNVNQALGVAVRIVDKPY